MRYRFAIVVGLVFAAAIAWSVYWGQLRDQALEGARQTALDARALGWETFIGEVEVWGYPSRLITHVHEPRIVSPSGDWTWSADWIETATLVYRGEHQLVDWPARQLVTTPEGDISIDTPSMRASLVFAPDAAPEPADALLRMSLDAPNVSAIGAGVSGFAGRAQLHLRRGPDEYSDRRFQMFARVDGLSVRPIAAATPPPLIEGLQIDGALMFDEAPARAPLRLPDIAGLSVEAAALEWSGATLTLRGEAERAGGVWTGAFDIEATDAATLIDRMEALQVVPDGLEPSLRAAVGPDGALEGRLIARADGWSFEAATP